MDIGIADTADGRTLVDRPFEKEMETELTQSKRHFSVTYVAFDNRVRPNIGDGSTG